MRFSVITPSYLGDYSGAASNRESKFIRCIESLNKQMFTDCEFIIVSDGCDRTVELMKADYSNYLKNRNFKLIEIPKQVLHSGRIRQAGIEVARGEYIVFVDTDDFIGIDFLYYLDKAIKLKKDPDVGYYNVHRWDGPTSTTRYILKTKLEENEIGNGMITFKRSLGANYDGYDGYRHDWRFIKGELLSKTNNVKELPPMQYFVCHIPGVIDV